MLRTRRDFVAESRQVNPCLQLIAPPYGLSLSPDNKTTVRAMEGVRMIGGTASREIGTYIGLGLPCRNRRPGDTLHPNVDVDLPMGRQDDARHQ